MVLNIHKPLGITPLQIINSIKTNLPEYANQKMGYANRLDPMAEGVQLVLTGDDLNKTEKFLKLNKTYKAQIIFGFKTDTHDLLGIASKGNNFKIKKEILTHEVAGLKGEFTAHLPAYSSFVIKGHPLFWWARNNKLNEIDIPERTTKIYSSKLNSIDTINSKNLHNQIKKCIAKVQGDFRQKEILDNWHALLEYDYNQYTLIEVEIKCSSGTYIRSIAHFLGNKLRSKALLFNLIRTSIGQYKLQDSIILDMH